MKPEPPESPPSWAGLKFHLLIPELQKHLRDFAHFQTPSLYFHLQSLRHKGKRTFSLIKPIFPSTQLKHTDLSFLSATMTNWRRSHLNFRIYGLSDLKGWEELPVFVVQSTQLLLPNTKFTFTDHFYTYLGFKIVLLPLLPACLILPGTSEGLCSTKL